MSKETEKEMEQLGYEDCLVSLNGFYEQYGVRTVMTDFRDAFPKMFEEVQIQTCRLKPAKSIPALLR